MTEQEATEMLKQLSDHYRQPVMPLKKFCGALTSWANCIIELNREKPDGYNQGGNYHHLLYRILMDINKSALLNRLLYWGEELRTVKCPTHEGTLKMDLWIGFQDAEPCECQGTGWLHAKKDSTDAG